MDRIKDKTYYEDMRKRWKDKRNYNLWWFARDYLKTGESDSEIEKKIDIFVDYLLGEINWKEYKKIAFRNG